jgi:hypothetical protein
MRRISYAVSVTALLALAGCGGGSSSSGTRITSLTISPAAAIVRPNGTRAFVPQIQGSGSPDTHVTWSADAGKIDNNGIYTAPAAGSLAHVTVKSVADPAKSATATITISDTAGPTFLFDSSAVPTLARHFFSIAAGGTLDLSRLITVAGSTNAGILWSVVTPNGGTITAGGVYTAPAANGSYLIQFASAADPTQIDYVYAVIGPLASGPVTGTIAIKAPLGTDGNPLSVLKVGRTYRFGYALTLQNSTDASVTWSATNGGAIGSDGSFTAPFAGAYTITVTSVASGQSASTTVTAQ